MCGIAGLWQAGKAFSREEGINLVDRMNASVAHRGPDAEGIWPEAQGRCVLGHRRLSIIDTSAAGRQPLASGDGHWWVTFNGEIYNFQAIRADLERQGVRFRSRSDTEVLIEAIAMWGADALTRFDGQFAFAAYDTVTGSLLLARDPFGEKPLYYTWLENGVFAFASELQALELLPRFARRVDVDAIAELLSFQYIGAPRSIYASVKKVPPGHWLRVSPTGQVRLQRYFEFRPGVGGYDHRPKSDLVDELEELLARSIDRRLISDVPLGAFLSGGVDSSTVCALVRRKLGRPLQTFSIGFTDAPESEHETANLFAAHLGTDHKTAMLDSQAADFLRGIGANLDEPNADSSCLPTFLLSSFARRFVTVALSGDGGDELFGGYGRYFNVLEERDRNSQDGSWRAGDSYYGNWILVSSEEHISELFGFVPPHFAQHLSTLRQSAPRQSAAQVLAWMRQTDVNNYMPGAVLPKVDRMSMRHALEVRSPFLNVDLARFAERLPDDVLVQSGHGKLLLREVAYRYLPRDLVDLPKQGFGLPTTEWARSSLLKASSELLKSEDTRLLPLFGRDRIDWFLRRQRTPGQFSAYQVWALATLESWLRHHSLAEVPDLTDVRPRLSPPRTLGAINAGRIAEGIWLVSRGEPGKAFSPEHDPSWRDVPSSILSRVIELMEGRGLLEARVTATETLPEWGIPIAPADIARLTQLRGATLIFLDADTGQHLDYWEMMKFVQLGVDHIIFAERYYPNRNEEIHFRQKGLVEKIAHIARLFLRKRTLIANRRLIAKPFGASRFAQVGGFSCKATALSGLAPIQKELSDNYVVFEGLRQLPPLHVSHAEIAAYGGGRYSVWNRELNFSATDPTRLLSFPYWIVERTTKTDSLLDYVADRRRPFAGLPPNPLRALQEALDAEIDVQLKAADSLVVITHDLSAGGAERQWVYLAIALKEAGYDVTFVTHEPLVGDKAHYLPLLKKSGIRSRPLVRCAAASLSEILRQPAFRDCARANVVPDLDLLFSLALLFTKIKPKAVLAQLDPTNIYACVAALIAGVPRPLMSFRNYNPTRIDYIHQDWYLEAYALLARSKRVLFSGNFTAANEDYADWIGLERDRVAHIPNAIDPGLFPLATAEEIEAVRTELHLGIDQPVILGAFRLVAEKCPFTFVQVCERVAAQYPALRVLLIGMGPLRRALEHEVQERGLAGQILFLGRRDDVNALMAVSSLLLLTSEMEGMPNVVLEAQLMELPVVATDAGGTRDGLIPDETGIICPIGDVAALAAACSKLIAEPNLARRMGTVGRENILTNFSIHRMARRYLRLVSDEGQEHRADAEVGDNANFKVSANRTER